MAKKDSDVFYGSFFGVSVLVFCGILIEFFPHMNHWLKAFLCLTAIIALVLGEKIWMWGKSFAGQKRR